MSKWPIYLFQLILQISHWSSRVKKIYKNPLKFPIIICTISSPLIFHFPITNEQAKIALKFVKTWNFLSRITKISSFLQSRKYTQYAPGSNSLRKRGGTITNTPFIIATSVRGTHHFRIPIGAVLWEEGEEKDGRERKERRIREAARQIESSDKAACSIEAAELLILITQLGERLRGGKAHVINLRQQHRYQTLHHRYTNQPHTTSHTPAPLLFPLPSTSSFQHSCIAIIHPQRHYVGID